MCIAGSVVYNAAFKIADGRINVFIFTVALTSVAMIGHSLCLVFYKIYMGENVTFHADKIGILWAVLAGLSIVIIDLSFFFAVRSGGLVATNITWSIGAIGLTALAGTLIFKEEFTLQRGLGLLLGAAAIFFLAKK